MVKYSERSLDAVFHALADATRRSIVRDLAGGERSIGAIAKPHRMSLAAVSKHVKVLEAARLIERRKQGSFQMVTLNAAALRTAEQWLRHYQRFWDDRLDALKDLLEKGDA
jgi:DNA-binding transcriptional ArsR family regulator